MRGQLSHFGSFSVPFPSLAAMHHTPQVFTTIHHTGEVRNARLIQNRTLAPTLELSHPRGSPQTPVKCFRPSIRRNPLKTLHKQFRQLCRSIPHFLHTGSKAFNQVLCAVEKSAAFAFLFGECVRF
jgi:hypothetical protein